MMTSDWQPARLKINAPHDRYVTIKGPGRSFARRFAVVRVRQRGDASRVWTCMRWLNGDGDLYAGAPRGTDIPAEPFPDDWRALFNTNDFPYGGNVDAFEVKFEVDGPESTREAIEASGDAPLS